MSAEISNQILPITLFDSYKRQEVTVSPETTVEPGKIKIYSCGPTVYYYQHIGNMRATWLPDTIVNLAKLTGYEVEWVQNITDVGHLVDDGDDGKNVINAEDKLEKGARREGKGVREIVDYYTNDFRVQCSTLNFDQPSGKMFPKATEYIPEQMILALDLLNQGKAYLLEDGIYYDSQWDKPKNSPHEGWQAKPDGVFSSVFDKIIDKIQKSKKSDKPFIIAIDGRAGSGKSTLAKYIHAQINNSIYFNLDAYTVEGGDLFNQSNIDRGFEIDFENKKYDTSRILTEILENKADVVILDGCFSFKNLPGIEMDYKVWVELNREIALERLIKRELEEDHDIKPEIIKLSSKKWQEAEERYLLDFDPISKADLVVSAGYPGYEIIVSSVNYTGRDIVNITKNPEDFALWKFVDENALQKWRFADYTFPFEDNYNQKIDELLRDLPHKTAFDSQLYSLMEYKWGCPGWHSECVAMISEIIGKKQFSRRKFSFEGEVVGEKILKQVQDSTVGTQDSTALGQISSNYEIDIHTGGEDHIDIHHKNEILQSEALGFHLSKYWVHNKFVLVGGKKMSKSDGNVYLVQGKHEKTGFYSFENPPVHEFSDEFKIQIRKKYIELKIPLLRGVSEGSGVDPLTEDEIFWQNFKFDPLAYRMMLMEHHYTEQMNFTWEKLWQSQMRLWNMRKEAAKSVVLGEKINLKEQESYVKMLKILTNNLDISGFLEVYQALLIEVNQIVNQNDIRVLNYLDHNFLKLNIFPIEGNSEVEILAELRQVAKDEKNYQKSDEIRSQIQALGYQIDDYANGWGVWWRGDV